MGRRWHEGMEARLTTKAKGKKKKSREVWMMCGGALCHMSHIGQHIRHFLPVFYIYIYIFIGLSRCGITFSRN